MFLLKVVMLHIKLKGIEHKAPCKHLFCPCTCPQPPDGVKGHFFLEIHYVTHQIKGNSVLSSVQSKSNSFLKQSCCISNL